MSSVLVGLNWEQLNQGRTTREQKGKKQTEEAKSDQRREKIKKNKTKRIVCVIKAFVDGDKSRKQSKWTFIEYNMRRKKENNNQGTWDLSYL